MEQSDRCFYCKGESDSGQPTSDGEFLCDDCCEEFVDWEGEE